MYPGIPFCALVQFLEYDSYRSDAPPTHSEKRVQQLEALLEERERESGRSLRALQQKYNAMEVGGYAYRNTPSLCVYQKIFLYSKIYHGVGDLDVLVCVQKDLVVTVSSI